MVKSRLTDIEQITFEENDERLKVVMPLERKWGFLGLYSIMLLGWIVITFWMVGLLLDIPIRDLPLGFAIVWVIILLVWAYIWYRLGRIVWRWWQYYVATREILFINKDLLIVRRPLSLLGVTDAYDMAHVGAFYFSEKHQALAFDYGSRGGLFGFGLEKPVARQLAGALNGRFFPHTLWEEEE